MSNVFTVGKDGPKQRSAGTIVLNVDAKGVRNNERIVAHANKTMNDTSKTNKARLSAGRLAAAHTIAAALGRGDAKTEMLGKRMDADREKRDEAVNNARRRKKRAK